MNKKEKLQIVKDKGFPALYSEDGHPIRIEKTYMYESKEGNDTGKYYPIPEEIEVEVFDNFKDASDWTKNITTG